MIKSFGMEDVANEVKRRLASGAKIAVIAWPGWGKTTQLIPSVAEFLLPKVGRLVITTPYHEIVNLLYSILSPKFPTLHVAGGHEMCLGALRGEFPYVRGLCNVCNYRSVAPIDLPSNPERTIQLATKYGACPYASQAAVMAHVRVLLKTHKFAPPKGVATIADEAHALWLGKLAVMPHTQYCDKDKEEVRKELEALREQCIKCIRAIQWFGQCDVKSACDTAKIELLEEIAGNECHTVEDGSVVHVRYPRHDDVVLAVTATPPRRGVPKGYEVVEVPLDKRPTLTVVENVRTTLRDFDAAQWESLLEYLYRLHGGLTVAAPSRVLSQTALCSSQQAQVECLEVWGRRSHGVTIMLPAIVVAEPWLGHIAYQTALGGDPWLATELTLIQMVQTLARVRPWTRKAAAYSVGPLVLRYLDYFSRLFEVEVVVWDGQELRRR